MQHVLIEHAARAALSVHYALGREGHGVAPVALDDLLHREGVAGDGAHDDRIREEANTFAASMCAMSDETKLSDALEIADSTGNAFVYKGGRLMGVVLSCDKYAEVSKGK